VGAAVDERDASLTEGAQKIEGRLQNTRALPHAPFDFNCSVEEYTMATSAAVQEEAPATRFAKDQLKAIIERIERLEEEKKTISDDIRDVYAEGKGNGFDVKALRQIIRLRKQDPNERAEAETILETYMQALGMI
jgi:uncharacterized protein (UPF0335 family)